MFLSAKTPLVAIDIGSHSIKVAQLAGVRDKYELLSFGLMPLESEAIVDGVVKKEDVVIDTLSRLVKAEKIPTRYAVASVAGEAVIVKKIKVPMMSEKELVLSINHEAEQYIPFDIDDVSIDFQIIGRGVAAEPEEESDQEKMEILLVAVQRELIDSRTGILAEAGLKPVIVDLDMFAIVNALGVSRDLSRLGSVALLDLGATFTHVNIVLNGFTAFTRDIPLGGSSCTQKLMSGFGVSYEQAEAIKRGEMPEKVEREDAVRVLADSFEKIAEEVQKSFEFFSATTNTPVERVFVSGGGALVPGAAGLLGEKLGAPAELLDPFAAVKIGKKFDREMASRMAPIAAVAIGLATRKFDYK
ncbi:MAG: type IV pilus assembly protein PilM [Nitrospinae bacterium]|nr:type IV pilus assembly protein PilM [Nitrospinota bacterium]